jgi:hypothetical protein
MKKEIVFRFNIDNKYGRAALEATFKAIMGYEQPIVKPPSDYRGDFFKGKLRFSSPNAIFWNKSYTWFFFCNHDYSHPTIYI